MPLRACFAWLFLFASAASAYGLDRQAKLFPEAGAFQGGFGRAVDVDGDVAVATDSHPTPVHVFEKAGNAWQQVDALLPAGGSAGTYFGFDIAVDGDRIVVGAREDNQMQAPRDAAVFVFDRIGGTWTQTAKITITDPQIDDHFAASVAVSGDTIAVGAPGANLTSNLGINAGVAYVFARQAGAWVQQARLHAPDTGTYDEFGSDVALQGDRLVVGAPGNDVGMPDAFFDGGAVYVFERSGGAWTQRDKLTGGADIARNQLLGRHLAMDGDRVIAGGYFRDQSNAQVPAVYVFDFAGNAWSRTARLDADGSSPGIGRYEMGVAGDRIVAGAEALQPAAGESYPAIAIFRLEDTGWVRARREPFDRAAGGNRAGGSFGIAGIGMDAGSVIVGAPLDDWRPGVPAQQFHGAAYLLSHGDGIFCNGFEDNDPGCAF